MNRFIPQNELEIQLVKAEQGELSEEEFLAYLLDTPVFMPIYEKHTIAHLQSSAQAKPLQLEDAQGKPVLILFSAPERAQAFVKNYPGYHGGLLVTLKWIFEKLGTGFGISLNPDQSVGLELEPDSLAHLETKTK
jgi:hypothetical protein